MIKNFKKELKAVKSNKNISEKLMVFSLYNELYNDILGNSDEYFMKHYGPFMEKTFELVVAGLNLNENVNVNAEQFMKLYFEMLKKSRLSSMPQVEGIIATYENELSSFINVSGYVNVIDQFESIPLNTKINIMSQFREYINNVFLTTIDLFGEENSSKLRHSILDMLTSKLENYLKDSLSQGIKSTDLTNNLKPTLVTSTKDFLMNKLSNGKFGFNYIKDDATRDFFSSFNELEQKMWLIGLIYGIAGYDKNDISNEKERLEEICKYLGISKFKYTKIAISMGIKSLKAMKEIESETFDGFSPKKRK